MTTFNVIPAIDILDGQVVRLTKGDYGQVDHYDTDPVSFAKSFEDHGATRIHLVDLNGAKDGDLTNKAVFERIRKNVTCALELGGGIRSLDNARTLFDLGINYIILGSLLIKNPDIATQIITTYPNTVIAGIDAKDDAVAVEGWVEASSTSTTSLIQKMNDLPLESIIFTDIDRDGTLAGPNLDALKKVAAESTHPVIASGGVSNIDDIRAIKQLFNSGVHGVIVGKAILSGRLALQQVF